MYVDVLHKNVSVLYSQSLHRIGTQQYLKYARIACQMLELLVDHKDGQKLLSENKFIPQLAAMLRDEAQGTAQKQSLLSKECVLKSIAREYFTMIGTISR